MAASLEVEFEPALVEEAVLAAVRSRREEGRFLRERDRVYEIGDPEAREPAFMALYVRWFERLALDRPFRRAFAERPEVTAGCGRCLVARALVARDESAELFVAPPALPTLLLRCRPEMLSAPERALTVLRHELCHIADMLDPEFGYEPHLTGGGLGSPHDLLGRDRYRTLWDTFIDGRLTRLGRAPATARAERLHDFRLAFPELHDGAEAAFERFFGGPRCTHADLLAFARGVRDGAPPAQCALCGGPTRALAPAPAPLPPEVLAAIGEDFPWWSPAAGLCSRCGELYVARASATPPGRC
jgi:hypothetical protein